MWLCKWIVAHVVYASKQATQSAKTDHVTIVFAGSPPDVCIHRSWWRHHIGTLSALLNRFEEKKADHNWILIAVYRQNRVSMLFVCERKSVKQKSCCQWFKKRWRQIYVTVMILEVLFVTRSTIEGMLYKTNILEYIVNMIYFKSNLYVWRKKISRNISLSFSFFLNKRLAQAFVTAVHTLFYLVHAFPLFAHKWKTKIYLYINSMPSLLFTSFRWCDNQLRDTLEHPARGMFEHWIKHWIFFILLSRLAVWNIFSWKVRLPFVN